MPRFGLDIPLRQLSADPESRFGTLPLDIVGMLQEYTLTWTDSLGYPYRGDKPHGSHLLRHSNGDVRSIGEYIDGRVVEMRTWHVGGDPATYIGYDIDDAPISFIWYPNISTIQMQKGIEIFNLDVLPERLLHLYDRMKPPS